MCIARVDFLQFCVKDLLIQPSYYMLKTDLSSAIIGTRPTKRKLELNSTRKDCATASACKHTAHKRIICSHQTELHRSPKESGERGEWGVVHEQCSSNDEEIVGADTLPMIAKFEGLSIAHPIHRLCADKKHHLSNGIAHTNGYQKPNIAK